MKIKSTGNKEIKLTEKQLYHKLYRAQHRKEWNVYQLEYYHKNKHKFLDEKNRKMREYYNKNKKAILEKRKKNKKLKNNSRIDMINNNPLQGE